MIDHSDFNYHLYRMYQLYSKTRNDKVLSVKHTSHLNHKGTHLYTRVYEYNSSVTMCRYKKQPNKRRTRRPWAERSRSLLKTKLFPFVVKIFSVKSLTNFLYSIALKESRRCRSPPSVTVLRAKPELVVQDSAKVSA